MCKICDAERPFQSTYYFIYGVIWITVTDTFTCKPHFNVEEAKVEF